jgi:hypothetical protein
MACVLQHLEFSFPFLQLLHLLPQDADPLIDFFQPKLNLSQVLPADQGQLVRYLCVCDSER